MIRALTAFLAMAAVVSAQPTAPLPRITPENAGVSRSSLEQADGQVQAAIAAGACPGAVLLVGRDGQVVWERAFGHRALEPAPEPMPLDAIFDLASLTKPVATAAAVMLVTDGGAHLDEKVGQWMPEFANEGKDEITLRQLLQHRSGLLPDNALGDYEHGPATARKRIMGLGLRAPPGERFIYSDVGFIVLGWLVEDLSGESLATFTRKKLFEPLGMNDTGFRPVMARREDPDLVRLVPTEPARSGEPPLRGVVHDPRARHLSGVAGHAGLFSTAEDLARYCTMMMREGVGARGRRVLRSDTVRLMTAPDGSVRRREQRGLGWDLSSPFSGQRGDVFPDGGYGHTGFTGTSLWLDPGSGVFVILLTSRLHPDGKGDVRALRGAVATAIARGIRDAPWPAPARSEPKASVRTGIDRVASGLLPAALDESRIGLITNHTGRTADGRRTIDVLHALPGVDLVRLFSPEHGLQGLADEKVGHGTDAATGLPVYSLYGDTRRPTAAMLEGLDTLVFDIQDIGCRFYTYISTLVYAMEEAGRHDLQVVVLDRPSVIGADRVEGPVADEDALDFVGCLRIPVRHGLTVGELARFARRHLLAHAPELTVVEVEGWRRGQTYDETGLPWINPSPNMRSVTQALLYPGIGLLETTNLSVGRGTPTPFEVFGAPWLDARRLVAAATQREIPGITFTAEDFTPDASRFANQICHGVRLRLTDRDRFRPVHCGLEIARLLRRLHPKEWETERYPRLLKHRATFESLLAGKSVETIEAQIDSDLATYLRARRAVLLYDR